MTIQYSKIENKFIVKQPDKTFKKLPPGCYHPKFDNMKNIFWFENFVINTDKIIDIPSVEYMKVLNQMKQFLKPESKKEYEQLGYLYKRSVLLHGIPGTGKTLICNRIALEAVSNGAICLFVKTPDVLEHAFEFLNLSQPETFVVVIMEEFDGIAKHHERFLLNLLDGQIQKNNVMYLVTTNYINKIPARLRRSGRINLKIEIHPPEKEARLFYIRTKISSEKEAKELAELTKGLTIDDIKETIQAVYLLKENAEGVVKELKNIERHKTSDFEETYMEDDGFKINLNETMQKLLKRKGEW